MNEIKKLAKEASPYLMDKYRQNLSENWGLEIDSEDRMGQVFTRFINSKIKVSTLSLSVMLFMSLPARKIQCQNFLGF